MKPPGGLGLADIKFWEVILSKILIYYTLADIANDGLLRSPLYEIMWRGWMADGKSAQTNRRYFFNAGWLWRWLAYLVDGRILADELPMIAPEFLRGVQ